MSKRKITGAWPAAVLREFAALVDAGMPLLDTLKSLSRHHRGLTRVMPDLLAGLQRGFQLGDVLLIAHAVSRQDAFLLNIAGESGKLPAALNALADRQEVALMRQQRLSSRLHLTRFVAVIVVCAGAVISISHGTGAGAAIASAFLQILLVFALIGLMLKGVSADTSAWLSLAWRFNLVRRWRRMQVLFEHYFYSILRWQLEAGLPAAEAMNHAIEALDAEQFRTLVGTAAMDLKAGRSFHESLLENDLIFTAELDQVILAGEAAGRLDQSLAQYQEIQQVHIDLATDGLLDWLPRFAYFLVILLALNAIPMQAPAPIL